MDALSRKLAERLVSNGDGDRQYIEWYKYKIELRLNRIITYGTILIIAFISGKLIETALFLLFLISLRKIAGGYHANSHTFCYISSISCYITGIFILPFMQNKVPFLSYIFISISALIVLLFAPIIHPNLPQKSGQRAKMRVFSVAIICMQLAAILIAKLLGVPTILIMVSINGMLTASILLFFAKITKQEGFVNV